MARANAETDAGSRLAEIGCALPFHRLLVWAKLRGTKDQGIAFADVPTDLVALKEKLGPDVAFEAALLDRTLLGQPIAYRVPTADELGL